MRKRKGRPSAAGKREARPDVVLVSRAFAQLGNKNLPDSAGAPPHGVPARVPVIEIADHRNRLGIRRPDGKAHPAHAVNVHQVRA